MVRVYSADGQLGDGDRIIYVETNGREQVTYSALASIMLPLMRNEEVLYPTENGYRGWRKPLDFLKDAYQKGIPKALEIHKIRQSNFLDKVEGGPEKSTYHH